MPEGKFRKKFIKKAQARTPERSAKGPGSTGPSSPATRVWTAPTSSQPKAPVNAAPAVPPKATVPSVDPTDEQLKVIHLPPDARIFVNAGPGTGKTYTLIERIKYLIAEHDLEPASEILVLSFSVSAVSEVKKRLTEAIHGGTCPDKALFLEIRTFDSFANKCLRLRGTTELRDKSYDARIQMATQVFKGGEVGNALSKYKHVLIDEVQDLVSVRADLALEVIKFTDCGFTLFGDPAQGIYDFQIDEALSKTTSENFLNAVRKHFVMKPDAVLDKNHRATGSKDLETIAVKGRALILNSTPDAYKYLVKEYAGLKPKGDLKSPALTSADADEDTCVLCRNNGQVLVLASALRKKGIPFVIQQSKTTVTTPAWIGRTFFGFELGKLAEEEFKVLLKNNTGFSGQEADDLWRSLLANCPNKSSKRISMDDLRIALNEPQVFTDVRHEPELSDSLRLSTIHRSKGREFNSVIVVMDGDGQANAAARGVEFDVDGESKVMFVGLTRARKGLARMDPGFYDGVRKLNSGERWVKARKKGSYWQFLGVEVGNEKDCDGDSFARGNIAEVRKRQEFLWKNRLKPLDVSLWFAGRREGYPVYEIHTDKLKLGEMSKEFGWAIWHAIKSVQGRNPFKFPGMIEGLWIRAVVTEVGNLGVLGIDKTFLKSGLWLGVRLQGLGACFDWREK